MAQPLLLHQPPTPRSVVAPNFIPNLSSPTTSPSPSGPIPSGTDVMLDAYLDPIPIDPLGVVDLHFMTQVEGDFPFLPQYFRNGDIVQSQGGLLYNFQPLPPTFPVIGFELHNVQHNCPDIGCITIVGLSQGNPIGEATNQMTGGGSQETIMLPLPPQGMLYDEVIVFSLDMITFGVWDVVIVDP